MSQTEASCSDTSSAVRSRPKQGPLRQAPVAGSNKAPWAWHSMAPPPVEEPAVAAVDGLAAVGAEVQVGPDRAVGEPQGEAFALDRPEAASHGSQLEAD